MTIAVDRTSEMQKTSESEGVYWYSQFFFFTLDSACQKITGGPGVAGLINYYLLLFKFYNNNLITLQKNK